MFKNFYFAVLVLALTACFSPRIKHSDENHSNKPSEQKVESSPANTTEVTKESQHSGQHIEPAKDSASHAHVKPDGVSPEKAMQWLRNGNTRFLKGWARKDGRSQKDRTRLAKGQRPHTIVLSCADSRVPPEHVFDQTLGEIFTVRVAGEALDDSVIASIEYAASHLGTRLVLVMGHTACGAVAATIENKGRSPAGSPSLDRLVADINPRVQYATPENKTEDLYRESYDNAKGVAADLVTRSQILRSLVAEGHLKVASAIYNLKTGKVDFSD